VIIKLFWRAGGAAFSKGNEEGKVRVKIEWFGGVLGGRIVEERDGVLGLGRKIKRKMGEWLAGGGWLGIIGAKRLLWKRHRKIEGNK